MYLVFAEPLEIVPGVQGIQQILTRNVQGLTKTYGVSLQMIVLEMSDEKLGYLPFVVSMGILLCYNSITFA